MQIDCYLSESCASENVLRENIRQALAQEAADAVVIFSRISDGEAAARGLKGSPSVLINGREVQPVDVQGFS